MMQFVDFKHKYLFNKQHNLIVKKTSRERYRATRTDVIPLKNDFIHLAL